MFIEPSLSVSKLLIRFMNYLSISNREEDRRQREIAFNTSLQFLKIF